MGGGDGGGGVGWGGGGSEASGLWALNDIREIQCNTLIVSD